MNRLQQLVRPRTMTIVSLVALLAVTVVSFGIGGQHASAQAVQDCSDNSIIKCGVASPADLVAKMRANDPNDLQAVYGRFSLPTTSYDTFAANAKMGTAKQNGDIVVNDQVVAHNAWSIGRSQFSYSTPYTVGGKTYYKSKSTDVLKQDLPVMVMFDENGKVKAAVLTACGNPMGGDIVSPTATCRQLNMRQANSSNGSTTCSDVNFSSTTSSSATTSSASAAATASSGDATIKNTYCFSTDAPATNGATVSKVVYDFGDGNQETRTNPAEVISHTYQPGNYTAKVTVYVKMADGREMAVNGSGCSRQISIPQPVKPASVQAVWRCTGLSVSRSLVNGSGNNGGSAFSGTTTSGGSGGDTDVTNTGNYLAYTFLANTSSSNAKLLSADFDFGDGTANTGVAVAGSDSNAISTEHTYKTAGTYTAKATVHFQANQDATAPADNGDGGICQKTFTINQPTTPAATPPTPQPTLPATGPAGIAGLFSGASAVGMAGYRWRARRRLDHVDQLMDSIHRK